MRLRIFNGQLKINSRAKEISHRKSGSHATPEVLGHQITGVSRLLLRSIDILPKGLDVRIYHRLVREPTRSPSDLRGHQPRRCQRL